MKDESKMKILARELIKYYEAMPKGAYLGLKIVVLESWRLENPKFWGIEYTVPSYISRMFRRLRDEYIFDAGNISTRDFLAPYYHKQLKGFPITNNFVKFLAKKIVNKK